MTSNAKSGADPCEHVHVDPRLGTPRRAEADEVVLVTGGSGFIGSHLVEFLLDKGYTVHVLDNLETGNLLYLGLDHPRLRFFRGDIMDTHALRNAMVGVSGVFHLGAASKVLPSLKDPAMGTFNVEQNAVGTSKVLEIANETKLVRKFVYAASSTYYGNQPVPFGETDPFVPTSPYAASKYMGELAALTHDGLYGMHTLSLRFFMVYGPRNPGQGAYAIVTGKFIDRFRQGLPLIVEGTGENFRDFVHVKDVARALVLGLQGPAHGQPINIGSGHAHTVQKVADLVSNNQQRAPPRKNDLLGTMANTCLAKESLNFESEYDFEDVMKNMIEEAKNNVVQDAAPMWSHPRLVEKIENHSPGWRMLPLSERGASVKKSLEAGSLTIESLLAAIRET